MGRFSNLEPAAAPRPAAPPTSSSAAPVARARGAGDFLAEAEGFLRSGRAERALRAFSRALEGNPNLVAAWHGQVRALLDLGELSEAELWAGKALELFREHPDLLAAKACALLRLGRHDDALGFCDAATAVRGAGSYPWLVRGEVALVLGRGHDEHCFAKSRELAGGDWFATIAAARVLYAHGRAAQALSWAGEAAAANPRAPLAWVVVGQCRERLGLLDAAEAAFRQAIAIDPDCPGGDAGLRRLARKGLFSGLFARIRSWFP